MRPTLIALHGYTMNADRFRAHLRPLLARLEGVDVVIPDAPFAASPGGVARLHEAIGRPAPPGPHLTWWDASEDGRVYGGFEETRARLADLIAAHPRPILLGFSQGAILAAAIAASSARGLVPPIARVVLVAGRVPRADAVRPLFESAIDLPSLHVHGERDRMTGSLAPALAACFVAPEIVAWPGGHAVPVEGDAASRILAFVSGGSPVR